MKRRDGRSISHEALEEIRIRAVQRVEAGEGPPAGPRGPPAQADSGSSAKAGSPSGALGLSDGHGEESPSAALRVRAVDTGDGSPVDSQAVRRAPQRDLGGSGHAS